MPAPVSPRWTGVFPIAPTPFSPSGDLDLEGQRRVLDCMIDQGVDGICILANYSEQFVLSDAERDLLLDLCLSHVAGRVPVIVTCSHFSTSIAADRARKAHAAGASMLMLMPPYHGALLRAEENAMVEHFARVAEAAPIPIMLQDAPLSGVTLTVPFLVRLAREVPQVSLFQDRGAGGRGETARPHRRRRRRDRRAVRRRGIDHADGRPRRRRDRDHAERAAAGPDQARGRTSPRRTARRGGREPTRASCRSSTTRTGSAGCAQPKPSCAKAASSPATWCGIPWRRCPRRSGRGCSNSRASSIRWRCAGDGSPRARRSSRIRGNRKLRDCAE